jgi:hypothetical protein
MNNCKHTLLVMSLVIATSIISVGCSKAPTNKPIAKTVTVEVPKVYKQGEEALILDNTGKAMYSIKINSAKVVKDYEASGLSSSKEIIDVSYTYKNIAKVDASKLIISAEDLIISDSTGAVGQPSDMYPNGIPQTIPVGTNFTVQGHYGLLNKTDKIKVGFSSPTYLKNGQITFELTVN